MTLHFISNTQPPLSQLEHFGFIKSISFSTPLSNQYSFKSINTSYERG